MVEPKVSIFKATKNNSAEIAKLHIENIKSGFLTKLGHKLLTEIYSFIIGSPESFCYIVTDGKDINGFICATEDCRLLYKRFFKNNFYWGFRILFSKIFRPDIIRKSIDHVFLPRKRAILPPSEILTIAVDNKIVRKGIGTKMFKSIKGEFARRKKETFIAVVGVKLKASNNFMKKMHGKKFTEIEIHKGERSNVYFWQ
jgi:hypothetical protein